MLCRWSWSISCQCGLRYPLWSYLLQSVSIACLWFLSHFITSFGILSEQLTMLVFGSDYFCCRTSTLPAFLVLGKASLNVPLCAQTLCKYTIKAGKPILVWIMINCYFLFYCLLLLFCISLSLGSWNKLILSSAILAWIFFLSFVVLVKIGTLFGFKLKACNELLVFGQWLLVLYQFGLVKWLIWVFRMP